MEIYDEKFDVCPHCGYVEGAFQEIEYALHPGTVINERYILGTVIGAGGFGITYVAWDTVLQIKIAVKEYFPLSFVGRTRGTSQISVYRQENMEQYIAGLERFLDEARRVAKFSAEPDIVHIYDFLQANNTAYIVMEYIEGETLKDYLKQKGTIPVDEAVRITRDVAKALEKVHAVGMIHRDISPDNILILKNGRVKLIDFGAARFYASQNKKQLSMILKPSFAPPEQYTAASEQDARTDIYALGAVLYNLLTGQRPKDAAGRLYEDDLIPPRIINPNIPIWLESVILRCLQLDAEQRFENVRRLIVALGNRHVESKPPRQSSMSSGAETDFTKLLIGIAIAVIALMIGATIFVVTKVIPNNNQTAIVTENSLQETTSTQTNDIEKEENDYETEQPTTFTSGGNSDYIIFNSGARYLDESDLYGLSAEELRLARNEIYARHGRLFEDEALQAYFDMQDWYHGTIEPSDFSQSMLNDYEIHNVELISNYESEMGYK